MYITSHCFRVIQGRWQDNRIGDLESCDESCSDPTGLSERPGGPSCSLGTCHFHIYTDLLNVCFFGLKNLLHFIVTFCANKI